MASHYRISIPLAEWMKMISQREYEMRLAYLDQELERPSREDWYLMQVAAEVRRNRVKDPRTVSLNDMKLSIDKSEPKKPPSRREIAERAKAQWFSRLGIKHGS